MRVWLLKQLVDNFDEFMAWDLKWARRLGAPAPHTLSSWAYVKSPFWTKIIDTVYGDWLIEQPNHCKQDYDRVAQLAEQQPPKL